MKYLLLIYMSENALTPTEREQCLAESTRLTWDLKNAGQYISASPLQPVATATTVRIREGRRLVTDGPFAETREQLGGFYLVDAANLDQAISIASKIPGARRGTVEIRPIFEIPGLPEDSEPAFFSQSK
jgi:hypothetical protein